MIKEEAENAIADIRTFMRDFKIKEIMEITGNKFEIITPKRSVFSFLWKGNRTINQLSDFGGIVTGSRALSMYHINGQPILNRKPQDWDFLIDKKNFMKFCGINNLKNIKYENNRVRINLTSGLYIFNAGYHSDNPVYLFRHDFDIVAKENMPIYTQIGKYKVATIESIIEEKLKIVEEHLKNYNNTSSKHIDDCIQIMTKLEAYGK